MEETGHLFLTLAILGADEEKLKTSMMASA
jgi:hypothetical protein